MNQKVSALDEVARTPSNWQLIKKIIAIVAAADHGVDFESSNQRYIITLNQLLLSETTCLIRYLLYSRPPVQSRRLSVETK